MSGRSKNTFQTSSFIGCGISPTTANLFSKTILAAIKINRPESKLRHVGETAFGTRKKEKLGDDDDDDGCGVDETGGGGAGGGGLRGRGRERRRRKPVYRYGEDRIDVWLLGP